MARPTPNFGILDVSLLEVGRLVAAMLQARDGVERRSWSHPQEPTTEEWWADVLADPRARIRKRRSSDVVAERTFYRLADELRDTILVACNKCDWRGAFRRDELIGTWGCLPDAELARTSRRAQLPQGRLALGPLRRALRRAYGRTT
jgi:hypothetical protein